MLMTLGTLATAVQSGAHNLVLFVMENRSYEITGNQKIPAAEKLDFPTIAKAVGFPHAFECTTEAQLETTIDLALSVRGPVLVSFAVAQGNQGPISRGPHEEAGYLKISLAESARQLREHLQ